MARGLWLPAVHFDGALRKELAGYLGGYDVAAIITDLESVVQQVPALARSRDTHAEVPQVYRDGVVQVGPESEVGPESKSRGDAKRGRRIPPRPSVRSTLEELRSTAASLHRSLAELENDEDTDDSLADALLCLRRDPAKFRSGLIEALDALDDAIGTALEMQGPSSRGGRPRNRQATWLVQQVADTLKRHGIKVTSHEDGAYASVLRTLWSHVLPGQKVPFELSYWLKQLKSQP